MKHAVIMVVIMLFCISIQSEGSPAQERVAESRIRRFVNGEPAYVLTYPWQVELYKDGRFHCGGSIISQEWVLTAAHCVQTGTAKDYKVFVGSSYLTRYYKHNVEILKLHEEHDDKYKRNDIAVLKVSPPFTYTEDVQPVKLADADTVFQQYETLRIYGHGRTERQEVSHLGQEGTMYYIPPEECKKKITDILPSNMCVKYGEEQKGFCNLWMVIAVIIAHLKHRGTSLKRKCYFLGDSGGGVIRQDNTLCGIVSAYFSPCGNTKTPSICCRVPSYIDWIKNNTDV